MAAAVITVSIPSGFPPYVIDGARKRAVRDITADTGDYAADGFTLLASQFGLKAFETFQVGSAATTGTDGATASVLGVEFLSPTQVRVHSYESGAQNAPLAEKTAEAYAANFTVRVTATGP
jgi:hypothetical protein